MKKHIDDVLMIVYAIFVTVILFFLSSCSDDCKCIDSHTETHVMYNPALKMPTTYIITVCDKYECDTLKQTK